VKVSESDKRYSKGTLAEGEGSIRLTAWFKQFVVQKLILSVSKAADLN
jgi:hypothetical protein